MLKNLKKNMNKMRRGMIFKKSSETLTARKYNTWNLKIHWTDLTSDLTVQEKQRLINFNRKHLN